MPSTAPSTAIGSVTAPTTVMWPSSPGSKDTEDGRVCGNPLPHCLLPPSRQWHGLGLVQRRISLHLVDLLLESRYVLLRVPLGPRILSAAAHDDAGVREMDRLRLCAAVAQGGDRRSQERGRLLCRNASNDPCDLRTERDDEPRLGERDLPVKPRQRLVRQVEESASRSQPQPRYLARCCRSARHVVRQAHVQLWGRTAAFQTPGDVFLQDEVDNLAAWGILSTLLGAQTAPRLRHHQSCASERAADDRGEGGMVAVRVFEQTSWQLNPPTLAPLASGTHKSDRRDGPRVGSGCVPRGDRGCVLVSPRAAEVGSVRSRRPPDKNPRRMRVFDTVDITVSSQGGASR